MEIIKFYPPRTFMILQYIYKILLLFQKQSNLGNSASVKLKNWIDFLKKQQNFYYYFQPLYFL